MSRRIRTRALTLGNRRRSIAATSEGNHHDRHQQPGRYRGPCTGRTDLLTNDDNASVIVLGDLNDEVEAATTQILNGPTGSEIGTGGFNQPDHGDRQRLWNLAPRIPEAQPFSRIYRGRKELIDHIFVSHALVGKIAQDTSPPTPQDAPRRGPGPGGSGKRSVALLHCCAEILVV